MATSITATRPTPHTIAHTRPCQPPCHVIHQSSHHSTLTLPPPPPPPLGEIGPAPPLGVATPHVVYVPGWESRVVRGMPNRCACSADLSEVGIPRISTSSPDLMRSPSRSTVTCSHHTADKGSHEGKGKDGMATFSPCPPSCLLTLPHLTPNLLAYLDVLPVPSPTTMLLCTNSSTARCAACVTGSTQMPRAGDREDKGGD